MSNHLKPQLPNRQKIRSVLPNVNVDFKLDNGEPVKTLLVYLPCKNGQCEHTQFFKVIKDIILEHFVLTYAEIEKRLSINFKSDTDDLFKKAVRKISQHTAKGELGELILFTLLDVYIGAPKILSKLSFKSSPKMPVLGADAVHAQYQNDKLKLYLGESKLYKRFSGAASSAIASISNALVNYEHDFDLIDSYMDYPEIDEESKKEIIDILNPFSENTLDLKDILHYPCFIGFVEPSILLDDHDEYMTKYKMIAEKLVKSFYNKLAKQKNDISKTALFLLPFSSIDVLVDEFTKYMGIKN